MKWLIILALMVFISGCVAPHGCSIGYKVSEKDGCYRDKV